MKSALALGLGFLVLSACESRTPVKALTTEPGALYTIELSGGATLKANPRKLDFAVDQVMKDDKVLVGIYQGNAPEFDSGDADPNPLIKPRGDGFVDISWRTKCNFPGRLHVWYDLRGDDAALSKQIAESVRPSGKCWH